MGKRKAIQLEFKHIMVMLAQQIFFRLATSAVHCRGGVDPSTRSGDLEINHKRLYLKSTMLTEVGHHK